MTSSLRPADVVELTQITHRYARALDLCQPELFGSVFTHDMVLEFHPLGNEPPIRYDGLRSFLGRPSVPFRTQHFLSNHEFEVKAGQASGICYVQGQHWLESNPADLYMVGARYEDQYQRLAGGWRIAERRCYYMWTQGDPSVMTGRLSTANRTSRKAAR